MSVLPHTIFLLTCLLFNACNNQQGSAQAFTTSMMNSHERAVENLEENTNLALSQTKSWLEAPNRIQFSPIQLFAEQIDADITEMQLAISKAQFSLEKGSGKLQESYLALRTDLETLEQKLNTNYQQFLSEYQTDFLLDDDDFVNKIEYFSSQVILLDEAWRATNLKCRTINLS